VTDRPEAEHSLLQKAAALDARLSALGSVLVAYSGGVDSAFLAVTATRILGDRALSVTADSPSYPDHHRDLAIGWPGPSASATRWWRPRSRAPRVRANPANRCYCKHELYTHLTAIARARGFGPSSTAATPTTAATIARAARRPASSTSQSAGRVGLTKDEIRELARRAGMSIWDEPASACLSSRIPYHTEVTEEKLRTIDAAEHVLRDLGFRVFRVRHHETIARLELGREEIGRALEPEIAATIDRELRALGYAHVTIDLRGYRLGSLNEALKLRPVCGAAASAAGIALVLIFLAAHLVPAPDPRRSLRQFRAWRPAVRRVAQHRRIPGYRCTSRSRDVDGGVAPRVSTRRRPGAGHLERWPVRRRFRRLLFFRRLEGVTPWRWATLVLAASPLFWF
jgi:uncharacterized protein